MSFWSLSAVACQPYLSIHSNLFPAAQVLVTNYFWGSCNSLAWGKVKMRDFPLLQQFPASPILPDLSQIPPSHFLSVSCLTWQHDTQINILLPLLLWRTHFCVFLLPPVGFTSLSLTLLVVIQVLSDTIPPRKIGQTWEIFLDHCWTWRSLHFVMKEEDRNAPCVFSVPAPFYLTLFPGFHSSYPTDSTPYSPCPHTSLSCFLYCTAWIQTKSWFLPVKDPPPVQYHLIKFKILPHHYSNWE